MDLRIVLILVFTLASGVLSAPQKQANSVKDKADPTKSKILKQINKVLDDGSYIFGYEADDGSFKVETRSKDGIVKGKYGFLDASGQLKTVEYTAGEKAEKSGKDVKDQTMASATNDAKTVKGDDDDNDGRRDFNSFGSQRSEPIDRQDDGQTQFIRQVGGSGGDGRYNPTTQLSGGRFSGPEEQPPYQLGQLDGQQQYIGGGGISGQPQYAGQQFGGAGGPQQPFIASGPGGFRPGRPQYSGGQPAQISGGEEDYSGPQQQFLGGGQGQFSGLDGGSQGFSGSPQQFSGQSPYAQQGFIDSPRSPYSGSGSPQQQFLGGPQQFSGRAPQQLGGESDSGLVSGIGRPDLQIQNYDPSQFSGAGQQQFGGPNRFSSSGSGANELGFSGRPTSIGSGGSTQEYVPSVELDGFSEDADQDGYVDPPPGGRGGAGDARTAQAAEKTSSVKTPDGERVTLPQGPREYSPQVLGPQGAQRFPQPQGIQGAPQQFAGGPQQISGGPQQISGGPQQISGGPQQFAGQFAGGPQFAGAPQQFAGGVSPYDEQQLQQIYQQQGGPGQSSFPGSAQPNFQTLQGQGGVPISQSPYQGQGIIPSQTPFQGQGIQSQPPFQGQPQTSGQPQFQTQGQPDFQSIPQQFQGQGGPQFQGQPQFNTQAQQFSPQFQGGGGPQQQFFAGGAPGGGPQGGQYLGGGFQPGFQGGPIPPQYFQGGRGQSFLPQQSPYAGGIQSQGFPFDYNPYAGVSQGGFPQGIQPGYPGGQIPQGVGPSVATPSSESAGSRSDGGEEKKA